MLERLGDADVSKIHDNVTLQRYTFVVRCVSLLSSRRHALRSPRRRHRILRATRPSRWRRRVNCGFLVVHDDRFTSRTSTRRCRRLRDIRPPFRDFGDWHDVERRAYLFNCIRNHLSHHARKHVYVADDVICQRHWRRRRCCVFIVQHRARVESGRQRRLRRHLFVARGVIRHHLVFLNQHTFSRRRICEYRHGDAGNDSVHLHWRRGPQRRSKCLFRRRQLLRRTKQHLRCFARCFPIQRRCRRTHRR